MKFGSLFSGIGGFDLAFECAGIECVWQVEIDRACQDVLARHWPNARRYDDVRECGKHNLEPVDLICGGFPCQDLSVAGRRAGLAGERSGLWFEFARVIDELEPGWVVIENVPGLLSSNRGRDFAVIIRWLAERGYGVAWRVLDAQYFGLAQRRKRVFVVGHLGDGRAAEVLFEREGGAWNPVPSREAGKGVARGIAPGLAESGRGQDAVIAMAVNAHPIRRYDAESETFIANWQSNGGRMDDDKAATLLAEAEHNYQFVWHNKQQSGEIRIQGDTINSVTRQWGTGGNNVPFVGVRRLTPTECERLQGFPDGWTAGQSDSARYRQLGNAVAVPVVEWIGKRIVGTEGKGGRFPLPPEGGSVQRKFSMSDVSVRRLSLQRIWEEEQRRKANNEQYRNREKTKNIRRDNSRSKRK